MHWLWPDWAAMFRLSQPLLETVLRGTIIYFSIIALMRVVLKRQEGSVGVGDMLLIVLIADASQNGMAGAYTSVTDGLVLIGTLFGWNYLIDLGTYRWKWMHWLFDTEPRTLISDGKVLQESLRKELLSEDDLESLLRTKGLDSPALVREARIEPGGEFTVVLSTGPTMPLEGKRHNPS